MNSSSSSLLERFCESQKWDEADIEGLSLTGATPCFEDVALLGSVELISIALLLWRACRLRGALLLPHRLRESQTLVYFKMGCCIVLALAPLLTLNVLIADGEFATFELVIGPLNVVLWLLCCAVVHREHRMWTWGGRWVLPFVYLFALVRQPAG